MEPRSTSEVAFQMNERRKLALINAVGLVAMVTFTSLVYLRTQEALILVVGGLISVVGVLGMVTSKT